jgi:hypothetical protein
VDPIDIRAARHMQPVLTDQTIHIRAPRVGLDHQLAASTNVQHQMDQQYSCSMIISKTRVANASCYADDDAHPRPSV